MFVSPSLSLCDLLGESYKNAVSDACAALGTMTKEECLSLFDQKVDFYPEAYQKKNDELLSKVGTALSPALSDTPSGAATHAFSHAFDPHSAPLTGFGCFRVGEDGRLYLIGKSEHYHASLGHRFPGYRLIDKAREIGLLNATHNNTRGYITRLCEMRLIQAANGIDFSDEEATRKVLASTEKKVLNRVINLETGSLACEAGVKMMLSRFYRLDDSFPAPKYGGKIPVFFVMGDKDGGIEGNYHGTTVLTQTFRGLWSEIRDKADGCELYKVVPVMINDREDFAQKLKQYNTGRYKTAGFMHEIVLMNYGAIRLTEDYLRAVYSMCEETDTPTMVDEIQTGMWYDGMFLYRLYGLHPDFVVVGKGFPGGEYPASKILTTSEMDTLNQFGALVTNGQEELASLSYLITMTFAMANKQTIAALGDRMENGLKAIQKQFPDVILRAEGKGLLAALHFHSVEEAAVFASCVKKRCIDTSAQLYKAHCLPAVLLKPPVTATEATIDYLLEAIRATLAGEN